MTIPEKIIDKIFECERYILMKEHSVMYKYGLQDIEEGLKVILTDHDWHKQYYREIDNVSHLKFTWKRYQIQQPLEGAALYIGRGQIVCSKQVQRERDNFLQNRPYYQTRFNNWQKITCHEAKLLDHKYFHR